MRKVNSREFYWFAKVLQPGRGRQESLLGKFKAHIIIYSPVFPSLASKKRSSEVSGVLTWKELGSHCLTGRWYGTGDL